MQDANALDRRLARIEGQVGGLRRMVRERAYCVDILVQISAVRAALNQVATEVTTGHIAHCVSKTDAHHPHAESMSQEELLDELRETLNRLVKS